mgnify:FL=1|jgi:hypothetical protein
MPDELLDEIEAIQTELAAITKHSHSGGVVHVTLNHTEGR